MAQQYLDGTNVRPEVEQVGCKAVTVVISTLLITRSTAASAIATTCSMVTTSKSFALFVGRPSRA